MGMVKEEARKIINRLPARATWDDLMYEFYVKKKLSIALQAVKEGRLVSHEEIKKRFLPR